MKVYIGPIPKYKKDQPEKERKVRIRIDKYDTWGLDHTISLIIHPLLIQLKATTHGAPITDDEDVPEHLRSSAAEGKKEEWDLDSNHFDRWNWILDEMIWAFAQIIEKDSETQIFTDINVLKKHHERIKNGTRLFGKYFQNLWD